MAQSAKEIGDILVAHCREGREAELLANYYSDDIVSVEAVGMGGKSPVTEGMDGVKGKHAWWEENFIVHDANVEGPFPHGDDRFGVIFEMDAEEKGGQRHKMKELAVYTVADGKIVREEFFYGM